jgi:hypothetical protein
MALPIFQRTVVTATGDIIAGAEVTVVNEVTGQNAVLFSNRAGTTSKSNPFFTGSDGFAQFYVAPGKYRVTATGTGGTVTWRWVDLPREAATTAQAIAGTANVVPDAAGVKAHVDARVTQTATDTTSGRLLGVGYGGLAQTTSIAENADFDNAPKNAFFCATNLSAQNAPTTGRQVAISLARLNAREVQLSCPSDAGQPFRMFGRTNNGLWREWVEIYHTGNTTVDGNGFIKQASPIVRLFADSLDEHLEPQGAVLDKVATGHYRITGTLGFAQEGWYIETPKDANGFPLFLTEHTQENDGTIVIKTFEMTGTGWRPEKGDPVDVSDGRWIDIRLEPHPTPEPEEEPEPEAEQ